VVAKQLCRSNPAPVVLFIAGSVSVRAEPDHAALASAWKIRGLTTVQGNATIPDA
jgi:hypothetical protein